jgi:peptidyl-prolyl cis-trans isomerase B (cyclophilin B)
MVEIFECRETLSVTVASIATANIPATKTLFVPIHGVNSLGHPLSYSVQSSNSQVEATVRSNHPYLKLSVANYGDMVFQLFDDLAPNTVSKIRSLVEQHFYDGLTFHRVVPNFVIQGGDPSGDGTGGPGFKFDNEFNANAIFSGSGQLAMANSGPNTNGSQFFVTNGSQRFLDFNYNLFGQLVEGQDILQAIDSVPTDNACKPLTPITITSASIINDEVDTVLLLKAATGSGSSTITLTATDPLDNSSTQQVFQANYQTDSVIDPPFLNPVADQNTTTGTPITIPLSSTDLQNNPVIYSASELDTQAGADVKVNSNNLTITPKPGFAGTLSIQLGVQAVGGTNRGSTADPRDLRTIKVNVTPAPTPIPVDPGPTNPGSGSNPGTSLHYVKAASGVSQHAINFTSRTFAQVLSGHHHGWDGLATIMARFNRTGNVTRLQKDLARLSRHIPYGMKKLMPAWSHTIKSASTLQSQSSRNALGQQLRKDLRTYLTDHVGVDFNIIKSHGHFSSDRLLKFNGRVS